MKHLTEAIMEVVEGLRAEAAEQDIEHVWVSFSTNITGEDLWRVSVSARAGDIVAVKAKDMRSAFDEAMRRVLWERDQAMKLIAAE